MKPLRCILWTFCQRTVARNRNEKKKRCRDWQQNITYENELKTSKLKLIWKWSENEMKSTPVTALLDRCVLHNWIQWSHWRIPDLSNIGRKTTGTLAPVMLVFLVGPDEIYQSEKMSKKSKQSKIENQNPVENVALLSPRSNICSNGRRFYFTLTTFCRGQRVF